MKTAQQELGMLPLQYVIKCDMCGKERISIGHAATAHCSAKEYGWLSCNIGGKERDFCNWEHYSEYMRGANEAKNR
jgi:hypothetical protein